MPPVLGPYDEIIFTCFGVIQWQGNFGNPAFNFIKAGRVSGIGLYWVIHLHIIQITIKIHIMSPHDFPQRLHVYMVLNKRGLRIHSSILSHPGERIPRQK